MDYIIVLEFLVIIAYLLAGARYGGYGLGLISGLGLLVFAFVFHLAPGKPPVDVLLTIMAVIGCASVLQTAGGLNVMMRVAERVLRRTPKYITVLAPITTWTLTVMCGTGHVVYTMFPIIYDIAIKEGVRPERPMANAGEAIANNSCLILTGIGKLSLIAQSCQFSRLSYDAELD